MPNPVPAPPAGFSPHGLDLFGEPIVAEGRSPISKRFIVAPFTVLNSREGDWQERKAAWLSMGIKSEVGRKECLLGNGEGNSAEAAADLAARYGVDEAKLAAGGSGIYSSATSIFDPVLCELMYSWYSAPGAQIVDPFAGGSVRGIVSSMLGRHYWGCDLRQEQVDANRQQAADICAVTLTPAKYICGDSMHALTLDAPQADFLFTCPPYGDLEVYSEDPADLSNMSWAKFCGAYESIIARACNRLKNHRFAAIVVGDFRDSAGHYRNFVSETIRAFRACGLELYNEAILVTAVGTGALRVTRQFEAGRKLVKVHQNILVFVKGDWKHATRAAAGEP